MGGQQKLYEPTDLTSSCNLILLNMFSGMFTRIGVLYILGFILPDLLVLILLIYRNLD
jgi:hypothetical protein